MSQHRLQIALVGIFKYEGATVHERLARLPENRRDVFKMMNDADHRRRVKYARAQKGMR